MKKKNKKVKEKHSFRYKFRKFINSCVTYALFLAILGCTCGASIIAIVLSKSDVVLDITDLQSQDASIIYDENGEQIALLGNENRINVTYESLPQCVIDAFISIEDSRYFEHPGFDLPRFTKAFLVNIKSMDFSQGGSTFTMQVIKNTYFELTAAKGKSIDRKIKEIYYSLQINNLISKEKLFEMYINKINFGSSTRGIQVASEYYFGKDASQLTLVEAAMLAGVINLPNIYNPYVNPSGCQQRTATVLYQMLNHGYITQDEYNLAIKVNVIDLLNGTSSSISTGSTIKNQAYIDVVINELIDDYGIDPYVTAVKVYTGLNQTLQTYYDEVADGLKYTWKDEYINAASICVNNKTGVIVGILGGRNYDRARRLNYAVDARYSSGSVAKIMYIYPLAFEYLPWMATHSTLIDDPIYYAGTTIQVQNFFRQYIGELSVEDALCRSLNIPVIHLYDDLIEQVGYKTIQTFLANLELDDSVVNSLNVQSGFGGDSFQVSCLQMVGAQAMLMNAGKYTTPHTITRIEFINSTREPIIANYDSVQLLSEGAAWLTARLEAINVDIKKALTPNVQNFARTYKVTIKGVETFAKTGTASVPSYYYNTYNVEVEEGAAITLVASTKEYSTATWVGYDYSVHCDSKCYLSEYDRGVRFYDTNICRQALQITCDSYGYPEGTYEMPSTVSKITTVTGIYPYEQLPSYGSKKYVQSGYTLTKNVKINSWTTPTIDSITEVSAQYSTLNTRNIETGTNEEGVPIYEDVEVVPYQVLDITLPEYSDIDKTILAGETYELPFGTLKDEEGNAILDEEGNTQPENIYTLKRRIHRSWIDGVVQYNVVVYDENNNIVTSFATDTNNIHYEFETPVYTDTYYRVVACYKYSIAPVQSNTVETSVFIQGSALTVPQSQTE